MLVGAADHQHLVARHPLVAAEDVGGHAEAGDVADVPGAVGVRPGDRGQDVSIGHATQRSEVARGLNAPPPPPRTRPAWAGRSRRDLGDRVLAGRRRPASRRRPRRPARPGRHRRPPAAAPADDQGDLAAHALGGPLRQLGQRPAADLLVGLGQLPADRGRPVGAEGRGRVGERGGQPVRGLEEDHRPALVRQRGQRPAAARRPCAAGSPRSRSGRSAARTAPARSSPRTARARR